MPLAQLPFDPSISDKDRIIALVNHRFGTNYTKYKDFADLEPWDNHDDYIRNTQIQFKKEHEGRKVWYYDRIDIGELFANRPTPFCYSDEMHFHEGLPHHLSEITDYFWRYHGLYTDEYEHFNNTKGSRGPYYRWYCNIKHDSNTLKGQVLIYIRNPWKDHFDEYLDFLHVEDFDDL